MVNIISSEKFTQLRFTNNDLQSINSISGNSQQAANLVADQTSESINADNSSVKVSISPEGTEKLAQEKRELGRNIVKQLNAKSADEVKKSENKNEAPIDSQIKQLEEQIQELKEKLTKLRGDDSESAKEERKALTAQILALQGVLMDLMQQKAETAKA